MSSPDASVGGTEYPWVVYQGDVKIKAKTQEKHAVKSLTRWRTTEQERIDGKKHHHIILCHSTHCQWEVSDALGGAGNLSFRSGRSEFDILHLGDVVVPGTTDRVDTPESRKCWEQLYRTHGSSEGHYMYGSTIHHVWIISLHTCQLVWPSLHRDLHPLVIHGFEDTNGNRLVTVHSNLEKNAFGELKGVKFSQSMPESIQTTPPINDSRPLSPVDSKTSTHDSSHAGSHPSPIETGEAQQQGVAQSGKSENNPSSEQVVKPASKADVHVNGLAIASNITAQQPHHTEAGTGQLESDSKTTLKNVDQPIGNKAAGHQTQSSEHGHPDKKRRSFSRRLLDCLARQSISSFRG